MCILSEAKKISTSDDHILNHQIAVKSWYILVLALCPNGQENLFPAPTVHVQPRKTGSSFTHWTFYTNLVSQFQLVRGPSPACPLEFREVLEFLAQTSVFCVSLPGPVWWPVLSPQGRGPGCLPLQTPVKETHANELCYANISYIISNCNLQCTCRYTLKTFNKP